MKKTKEEVMESDLDDVFDDASPKKKKKQASVSEDDDELLEPSKKTTKRKGVNNAEVWAREPMPWAHPACVACEGVGLNSKGGTCAVCVQKALKKGEDFPQAKDYEVTLDDDGYYVATAKDESEQETEPEEDEEEAPKPQLKKVKKPEPEPEEEPPKVEDDEPKKKSPGRPLGKPTLYIGCMPETRNGCIDIDEVFKAVAPALAKRFKKDDYYDCDVWERRTAFQRAAENIVDRYRNKHIVCNSRDPDRAALVEAMRPHSEIIRGVFLI